MSYQPPIVPPFGPPDAPIAFIGEAPGEQEVRSKKPFIGKSGQLLQQIAFNAGIIWPACYLTNVVKERPTKNDIKPFIDLSKKVPIVSQKFLIYQEMLREELSKTSCNLLVAVGGTALYALTGISSYISKRRGSIYESTLLPGRKVMALIHPRAWLNNYDYQMFSLIDLRRANAESTFPELRAPKHDLCIFPSFEEAIGFLEMLQQEKEIAFDIEVKASEVSHISFASNSKQAISIAFIRAGQNIFTADQELEIWSLITKILEDSNIKKLIQNAGFDYHFLFRKYGIRTQNIYDTMIAQAIIMPDYPKGLDFLCSIYTREPYYKDEGKIWFKLGTGSEETFSEYSAKDSIVLPEIKSKQLPKLERDGNFETYNRHVRLIHPLVYMQERGIKMDVDGIQVEREKTQDEIARLTFDFQTKCGYDINPNSTKQLKEYFYGKLNLVPYTNRKTGAATTDEKALKRLSRRGFEEATMLLKLRTLSKYSGTYLSVPLSDDGRLRCSYNSVGTKQGRLSSSRNIFGEGTNMQNLPREMKKFMLADDGYLIFEMDLGQAENRIVAYISPEPKMIRAFEEGIDVHSMTAALIFGKNIHEVSNEPGSCELAGGRFSERFWGKKANHGLNYDLGYRTFAFYYEIPEADAKFIVQRYHQAYPGIHVYHRWVQQSLNTNRCLTNCYSRTRRFLGRRNDDLYKEAYSFIPQSTVPDHINEFGLLEIWESNRFPEVELLNQVHDSIVFQIPIAVGYQRIAQILLDIKKSLERPITWKSSSFVIPVDCKAGTILGEAKEVDLNQNMEYIQNALKSFEPSRK